MADEYLEINGKKTNGLLFWIFKLLVLALMGIGIYLLIMGLNVLFHTN